MLAAVAGTEAEEPETSGAKDDVMRSTGIEDERGGRRLARNAEVKAAVTELRIMEAEDGSRSGGAAEERQYRVVKKRRCLEPLL